MRGVEEVSGQLAILYDTYPKPQSEYYKGVLRGMIEILKWVLEE